MRLINTNTGFEIFVIHDKDHSVEINEPQLKNYFLYQGIQIPAMMQEMFEGRERVKLGEKNFSTALKEIYWRFNMDNAIYKWFK